MNGKRMLRRTDIRDLLRSVPRPGDWIVAAAIALYADEDRRAHPSLIELAALCHVHPSSVRRIVGRLEAADILTVETHPGRASVFILNDPAPLEARTPRAQYGATPPRASGGAHTPRPQGRARRPPKTTPRPRGPTRAPSSARNPAPSPPSDLPVRAQKELKDRRGGAAAAKSRSDSGAAGSETPAPGPSAGTHATGHTAGDAPRADFAAAADAIRQIKTKHLR